MSSYPFKISGGDFPKGTGDFQDPVFAQRSILFPQKWSAFWPETVPITQIELIETINEDMVADGMSKGAGAVAGALLFGSLGMLAGLAMGGKQKKEVVFLAQFEDE